MAPPEHEAAQVRVGVGEVAAIAYAAVFGRLGLVLELGWLPLLIMLAVELVPDVLAGMAPAPAEAPPRTVAITALVRFLAALVCLNAFAVRWYQAPLRAHRRTTPAPPRRLLLAAWARFVAYTLLFSLPTAAVTAAHVFLDASAADDRGRMLVGAGMALSVAIALVVLRLSLIWPAAAQGTPMGWGEAWRRMRGNTWRLAAVALVISAPVFITVIFVLVAVLAAAHVDLEHLPANPPLGLVLLGGVVDTMLKFIFVALGATVLAEFHRRIVRAAPAERRDEP
jgi:hypothetical protein